jgi:SAM-dependent methyltransferase
MEDTSRIADAYDRFQEREWIRLVRDPYHTLEFTVTWHYLRQFLPPQGFILDAGGGPGRYALELCRAGYDVVLLDLSSGLVSFARDRFEEEPEGVRRRLRDVIVGDIQDLSRFGAAAFDAVLCLGGPLTHISSAAGRQKALSELARVAKPGAVVYISVMGYLAVLRTILSRFSHELVEPGFRRFLETGDTTGTTGTVWHFFRADELRESAESHGLMTLDMAGCEGLSTGLAEATNALAGDAARWEQWEQVVLQTASQPAVVDMAEHILYIGRKPVGDR